MSNKLVPQSGILDVQGNILQHGKPLVVKDDLLVLSDYKVLASAVIDTSIEPKIVSVDVSAVAYDTTTGLIKAKTLSSLTSQEILGISAVSVSSGNTANLITRGILTSTLTGVTVGDSVYATATGTLSLTLSSKRVGYILTTGANAKVFVDIHTQNTAYIQNLVLGAATIPTGLVAPFPGSVAPVGWLICDGTSYLTATYPQLFGVTGYNYGGSLGNFNVPDYRGMFLRGTGTHGSLTKAAGGNFTGPSLHGSALDLLQGHFHGTSPVPPTGSNGNIAGANGYVVTGSVYENTVTAVTGPTSDGTHGTPRIGNETAPVSYGVNYIIKT